MAKSVSRAAPLLGLLLAMPPGLQGQEWTGRIMAGSDSAPVAGALVVLLDDRGAEAGRTMTTESGGFGLKANVPGEYRLRILRIGYAAWVSPPARLEERRRQDTRIVVEDRAIQLAAIEVTATRSRCGVRPGDGDVIASLLAEAEKALAITEQTIRQGNLRFRTEVWSSRPLTAGATAKRSTASSTGQAMWPVASAHPDTLARYGFVFETPARAGEFMESGPVYFGPDARVLFAPWFLDEHCFSVAGRDTSGVVMVEFVPARRSGRQHDIRGALRLDAATLELRSLEFSYTGLGRWVPADSAGGQLSFRRLPTGAWIIDEWSLRAPIPMVSRRDTTFFGFAEAGGKVKEIRDSRSGRTDRLSRAAGRRGSGAVLVTDEKAEGRL